MKKKRRMEVDGTQGKLWFEDGLEEVNRRYSKHLPWFNFLGLVVTLPCMQTTRRKGEGKELSYGGLNSKSI